MGDNYRGSRQAPKNVPNRRIQSHYSDNYEELITAFGEFMHNQMPKVMLSFLPMFLELFLRKSKTLDQTRNNNADLFNALFHKAILKHFNLPENLSRIQITNHIREKNSIARVGVNLPPEIVMIYGETGIFERLIYDFIDIFINSGYINGIDSWETLENAISIGITTPLTKDSTIFSTHVVKCGGKAFSMYMFKLLAVNYLLYRKSLGQEFYLPQKFYSNTELKEHFEANIHLLES